MATMNPIAVCDIFKKHFGLRDGIKSLHLDVTRESVLLKVVYYAPDTEIEGAVTELTEQLVHVFPKE